MRNTESIQKKTTTKQQLFQKPHILRDISVLHMSDFPHNSTTNFAVHYIRDTCSCFSLLAKMPKNYANLIHNKCDLFLCNPWVTTTRHKPSNTFTLSFRHRHDTVVNVMVENLGSLVYIWFNIVIILFHIWI